MFIDSHCHLNLIQATSIKSIIETAKEQNVKYLLNVSIDLETFPQILATTKEFANVYASVGIHPNSVEKLPKLEELIQLADDGTVIAVGETGLDYFYSKDKLELQQQSLRLHIQTARKVKKPLIIHSRDAKEDVLRILAEESADEIGGIMHCFVDDLYTAQQAIEMGFYISFSGIVTFKNAKNLQEVAQKLPLERILIETDSPFLAPMPHRGKQNQPAYVEYIAKQIALLHDISIETVAKVTTNNFLKLFRMKI
jgi:TatD DNase family protein